MDFLETHSAQINFKSRTLKLKVQEEYITLPLYGKNQLITNESYEIKQLTMSKLVTELIDEGKSNQKQLLLNSVESPTFNLLLEKYKEIFREEPGRIDGYECNINIKPTNPIAQRPYPIPMHRMSAVEAEINKMLKWGIIEKSTSPWSQPLVPIIKKSGDIRVCIDARKLNACIIPDKEQPIPIEQVLAKFETVKYLSSIDLRAGYWQCPLNEKSRDYVSFLFK